LYGNYSIISIFTIANIYAGHNIKKFISKKSMIYLKLNKKIVQIASGGILFAIVCVCINGRQDQLSNGNLAVAVCECP